MSEAPSEEQPLTHDTLYRGRLLLAQPARGYRFSLDSYLLAHFAPARGGAAVELGVGSGVVSLALLALGKAKTLSGIELQPELAALARQNALANGLAARLRVIEGDLRKIEAYLPAQQATLVVCNPPFFPKESGRDNPNPQEALARFEHACTIREVARAARYLVKGSGRVCVVYPAPRLAPLLAAFSEAGLSARRLRAVHPKPDAPARLVLVEAVPRPASTLAIEAPLFLADAQGKATDEAQLICEGPSELVGLGPRAEDGRD